MNRIILKGGKTTNFPFIRSFRQSRKISKGSGKNQKFYGGGVKILRPDEAVNEFKFFNAQDVKESYRTRHSFIVCLFFIFGP